MEEADGFFVVGKMFQGHRRRRRRLLGRGLVRFVSSRAADLFQKIIDIGGKGIDICIESLPAFHFFHLAAQEILRTEHQVEKLFLVLWIKAVNAFVADIEEHVFYVMSDLRHSAEFHHGRGAFDRVHDAENLVDVIC